LQESPYASPSRSFEALLDVETLHSNDCAQKGTEGKTGRAPAIPSAVLRRRISRTKSHLGWHWPIRPTSMACSHMSLKGAAFCQLTLPRPKSEQLTATLRLGQLAICCRLHRHELLCCLPRIMAAEPVWCTLGLFAGSVKPANELSKQAQYRSLVLRIAHWLVRNAGSQAVACAISLPRSSNRNSVYSDPELLELSTFESAPKRGPLGSDAPPSPAIWCTYLAPGSAAVDKVLIPLFSHSMTRQRSQNRGSTNSFSAQQIRKDHHGGQSFCSLPVQMTCSCQGSRGISAGKLGACWLPMPPTQLKTSPDELSVIRYCGQPFSRVGSGGRACFPKIPQANSICQAACIRTLLCGGVSVGLILLRS
jgi:hypothetical protein